MVQLGAKEVADRNIFISKRSNAFLLALVFTLVLLMSALTPLVGSRIGSIGSASAFTGTGAGTAGDPYLIDTCQELQSIGATEETHDRLYKLTSNIDCSATSSWNAGAGFEPLPNFDGTLDGQGYTISNLSINRPSDSEVGLFTRLQSDAMVTRLSLDDATIIGSNFTGAIASQANYAIIRDVHVDGTVSTSENYAGGLVGSATGWENDSVFQRSSFSGSITSASFAGGILGQGYYGFTLEDVYVDATINSDVTGGLMGQGFASCGYRYINRALVKGALSGSSFVGGFTGKYENISCNVNQVNNSVSLATLSGVGDKGGAVGNLGGASVTFDNIYFDQSAAGTSNCVGSGSGSSGTCGDIGSNVAPAGEPYAQ